MDQDSAALKRSQDLHTQGTYHFRSLHLSTNPLQGKRKQNKWCLVHVTSVLSHRRHGRCVLKAVKVSFKVCKHNEFRLFSSSWVVSCLPTYWRTHLPVPTANNFGVPAAQLPICNLFLTARRISVASKGTPGTFCGFRGCWAV